MPLRWSKTITTTGGTQASYQQVLSTLQSPHTLIGLNPAVTSIQQSSSDPSTYIITDSIKLLRIPMSVSYTARFTIVDDGIDCVVNAPLGTRVENFWRACVQSNIGTDGAEGSQECVTTETATVTAFFLFYPLVTFQFKSLHESLMKNLVQRLKAE